MVQQGMVALLRGASSRWGASSYAQRGTLLPSMYSLSRAFSSKLFVGGLSYHTTEDMLRKAFAEHGDVVDVRIITDRESGRSRGFGFVTFSSESDAEAAKAKMSSHLLDGRFIRVDLASNRPPQSPAAPRPFGNSGSSSSPSGFSFGTPGTRPPVVEDWGPLPSHSTNTTQTQSQDAPRPFGNSGSSSSPGFSFGTPGTRPPVVEDWGPLPTYSTNTTQTNTTAYQGGFNSTINTPYQGASGMVSGGTAPSFSAASSSSTMFQQVSSSTSNTSAFQSSTSASEVRSSSFNISASSNAASVTAQQSTVFNSGIGSPNVPSAASTQGIVVNNSTEGDVSSFEAGRGHDFASPSSSPSEAWQVPAQTGSLKQDSNVYTSSQSGSRLDSESSVDRTDVSSPPNPLPSGSSTSYDFRSFPDLNSSAYKDYKPPGELQNPKRTVVLQKRNLGPRKADTWESKLTEAAIPSAKGPLYDFGLGGIPDSPPSLGAGASPQGGFNLSVCLDDLPEAEPVRLPYSIFTARTLPPLDLPWLTPEADNWSEIGKPPRRIEDSPYSPFSPDLKDDPEFWWDPYDFDPEAKLLKEAFAEEPAEAAKVSKEEIEEAPAANAAA